MEQFDKGAETEDYIFNNFKHKLKKLFFSIDWSSLFSRLLASVLVLIVPRSVFLRDHNRNKASKIVFVCNTYHHFLAIKDIVSYFLVFHC